MLVIHGKYFLKRKRVAYRNDYCLKCEQPRRSEYIRSFDVGHIFWIPLLPLGFWSRWLCSVCGKDPHFNIKTRRPFLWLGLLVCAVLALAFWAGPVDRELVGLSWAMRVGAPLGAVLAVVSLIRTRHDSSLAEKLSHIAPAADEICPFCGARLIILSSRAVCPSCSVARF